VTSITTATIAGESEPVLVAARSDGSLSLLEVSPGGQYQDVQNFTDPNLRDPSQVAVISDANGILEGYVTNRDDNVPLVFDFNFGAPVATTIGVTPPIQLVAELTELIPESLPTVATLTVVPIDLSATPDRFGDEGTSFDLGSPLSGPLLVAAIQVNSEEGGDLGAGGMGDVIDVPRDFGRSGDEELETAARLTDAVSGLDGELQRGLQDLRKNMVPAVEGAGDGLEGMRDALDAVFRDWLSEVGQAMNSVSVPLINQGRDALRSSTLPLRSAVEINGRALQITDSHWIAVIDGLVQYSAATGRIVGHSLQSLWEPDQSIISPAAPTIKFEGPIPVPAPAGQDQPINDQRPELPMPMGYVPRHTRQLTEPLAMLLLACGVWQTSWMDRPKEATKKKTR
jgi:hypothetical protein